MTHLYLIRHGRSTWNATGRVQGQADPPLDAVGRQQARALAARLQTSTFDAFYSSPLSRAHETAQIIAAAHAATIRLDDRLKERAFGEWTGLTGAEIDGLRAEHPDQDWRVTGPPGGESRAQTMARAAAVFTDIRAAHPDQRVLVVAHGGLLNAYLLHIAGLPPNSPMHFHLENTALTRLRFKEDQVYILALNDDRHLDGMRNE